MARTGRSFPSRQTPALRAQRLLAALLDCTAAITGTATASISETDIVTGGKTIIITLTGDIWVAAGGAFDAQRANILAGLDGSATWDAEVADQQTAGTVVRTSDTVVTITLEAAVTYDISSTDTVTVIVPSSALATNLVPVTGTPTFAITAVGGVVGPLIVGRLINNSMLVGGRLIGR